MNIRFVFLFFLVFISTSPWSQSLSWRVEISLNDRLQLPFFMHKRSNNSYVVVNGSEKIELNARSIGKDSIELRFVEMDSYLRFAYLDSISLRGYWKNKRGKRYPLTGTKGRFMRFEPSTGALPKNVSGSYQVVFGGKNSSWPAVGLFEQNKQILTGTFLTETGDYRFLEGNVFGNRMYLSCFAGAHAFVFTATIDGDSLDGVFYSGSTYNTTWKGVKNEAAEIGDPNSLTYLTTCLLYTSPSPRDQRGSRIPSSA